MKALIWVRLRDDIPDTQGAAVKEGLHELGFQEVKAVGVGKLIEVEFETGDQTSAQKRVEKMCTELLVHQAIEEFKIVSIE